MSKVNMELVNVRMPLKAAHFPFDRVTKLDKAMTDCITDYYIKVSIGGRFEARGIVFGDIAKSW
jgi:hypothetical protein